MNPHATLVGHRSWRLILAIASSDDDARRILAREVGEDTEAWYQIALVTALQVANMLDAEYMTVEAMRAVADNPDLDLPEAGHDKVFADPDVHTRAREYTIGRIEGHLASALDTPADPEGSQD